MLKSRVERIDLRTRHILCRDNRVFLAVAFMDLGQLIGELLVSTALEESGLFRFVVELLADRSFNSAGGRGDFGCRAVGRSGWRSLVTRRDILSLNVFVEKLLEVRDEYGPLAR